MRRTLLLLVFALVGWALCGATIGVGRQLLPMEQVLVVHAIAAPLIFGVLAYFHARHFASLRPLPTGVVCLGVVVLMDAGLVAPFLENSFAMFRSPIGTWIPFALIFVSVWASSHWVMGPGPEWLWHATAAERRRPLPGDPLLPQVKGGATHGVTIDAPPDSVWPWLVQMGCDRAGWYSHDRLDNGGRPSADRIVPELQNTKLGDVLPSRPGHRGGFEVLHLEASKTLVLGAYFQFPGLAQLPWDAPRPLRFMRATWAFALEASEKARTRLLVRTRGLYRPAWLGVLAELVMGPAHVIMQRRQLLGLKARAESRMAMKRESLFDSETVRAVEERIEALKPGAESLWGRMSPAQMMAHCAEVHEVWLGKKLGRTPLLIRMVGPLLKGLLVSDKPYRRNSPTHPQYRMTNPRDFTTEKARLLASVRALSESPREEFRHPIFGRMTAEEKGWATYRHLDHHLSQFGV